MPRFKFGSIPRSIRQFVSLNAKNDIDARERGLTWSECVDLGSVYGDSVLIPRVKFGSKPSPFTYPFRPYGQKSVLHANAA